MSKTKKDNGDGCVYKVSDTKWRASLMIGYDENGKPKRKQFSGKTEAIVKRKLREYKKAQGTDTVSLSKLTVSEYFDLWLALKKIELKPLSYRRLESTIDTHIKPYIGLIQFGSIETDDIQDLINSLYGQKSYSTIKKVFDAINAIYKYDLSRPPEKRVAKYNPCANVVLNRQETKEIYKLKYFTDDELIKIKKEISKTHPNGKLVYPYGDIYLLILNTGMRLGEALALNRDEDIDMKCKTIKIDKNIISVKDDVGYRLIVQQSPKTSYGNRVISLNDGAMVALQSLENIFPDTQYIALNSRGNRVSPANAEKTFESILKGSGVEPKGRRCHALRHTFATKLFECGTDVKVVSEILGHRSTSITYDTYISVIQKLKANAVNKIPNF